MNKILANLSIRQRISIAVMAVLAGWGLYALVHSQREGDFKPLFTGLAPEDAAGIVQKLKETGVDFRLPENGGSVLVPAPAEREGDHRADRARDQNLKRAVNCKRREGHADTGRPKNGELWLRILRTS